jgi:hypothetical protein
MGKMESAGDILSRTNPHNSERTADSAKSWRAIQAREKVMRMLIIRLYTSARKELPEDDVLDTEARIALDDLKEIPDSDLAQAFREAQVEAGGFIPSNGLIVKCFRESKAKGFEDAQKAIRQANTEKYLLAPPSDDLPTPEERERIAAEMAAIARRLAGEA